MSDYFSRVRVSRGSDTGGHRHRAVEKTENAQIESLAGGREGALDEAARECSVFGTSNMKENFYRMRLFTFFIVKMTK